ncbi:glycolate oxidase [Gordoniibacillus kamchatkensis]|uniref:Glycolate oxidase iron-sulfur subunit n=1 Tax=Gordoniibacillus kamchatkensis TaxID=1590651 RepID=A0ABR5A5Z9_9BACL|nr:glycolate oxidase [Paenibacillus sp. VKM B-2647]
MTSGKFNMDDIMNCMHCGFCLPSCPTYRMTGKETQSPRGRIALMKGAALGQLELDAEFERNMYDCLGCRACETACPAGVPYGTMIEAAREAVEDKKLAERPMPFVKKLAFRHLFPHPKRMQALGTVLWGAQALGLQKLADKTGLIRILPREMAEMQKSVGRVASPFARAKRKRVMAAEAPVPEATAGVSGAEAAAARTDAAAQPLRVGFFTGCIMDVMFYETNQATAKLLAKAGCEVVFAEAQTCCGALHAHSGYKDGAKELAMRNIEAFERAGVDLIVNNAGGCGAALKEYHHWFHDDPAWHKRAMAFVAKMRDANELLAELPPLKLTKPVDAVVTYQDSCHLANGQGVRNQPRQLIRSIPGVQFVEMKGADSCCGSAGIYNITNYDKSMELLDDKMNNVKKTQARLIVTSNPGCLLQMKQGIIRAGLQDQMEAVHIMDLLERAL